MTALVIPANPGFFVYNGPGGRGGHFRPSGGYQAINADYLTNPADWSGAGGRTLAARLLVGFNVGDEEVWTLDDAIAVVRAARPDRPDATYVLQKGVYTSKKSGKVVEEPGCQVIVIDVWKTPARQWRLDMVALAERLAEELAQEEVIVDIQRGGITKEVIGVVPREDAPSHRPFPKKKATSKKMPRRRR